MSKKETVYDIIGTIAEKVIPDIMEKVLADKTKTTEQKVTIVGLLQTTQHHLRLAQASV